MSGLPGSIQLVAREGSPAPGTTGVFTGNGWLVPRVNSSGVVAFSAALTGAGIDSTNNTGIWVGAPGALALAARAGNPAPGAPEGVVFSGGMQNWLMLNDAGQVVFRANLAGPGIDSANDAGIWAGAPGALQLIAREGDVAPGTGGALFGPFNYQFAENPVPVLNAAGEVAFAAHHSGGRGIWRWSGGVLELVTQTGSSAYGMSGTFNDVRDPWMNASGHVVFRANVEGEGIDYRNDSGIWTGVPGDVELVVREGNPAPGTSGQYLSMGFSNVGLLSIDDAGYITFPCGLFDSDGVGVPGGGGVWRYGTPGPGTWSGTNLVLHGMPAPGLPGVEISSVWAMGPHAPSSVPLSAYLNEGGSNSDSLWLQDPESPPLLIARQYESFDIGGGVMREVSYIHASVQGYQGPCHNSNRQVVIGLGFVGGSAGIFAANPSAAGDCENTPNYDPATHCCDPATGTATPIDDGNECTDDACDPATGVVTHTDNYDPATECCDPATGTTSTIDDGNECTDDACNPATGVVTHRDNYDPATECCDPATGNITDQATWFEDADGDGFGNPAVSQDACDQPGGFVDNAADGCPNDPDKTKPGESGCGTPEAINEVSLPNADGNMVTITSPPGTALSNVSSGGNPSPGDAPAGVTFPAGFVTFRVDGVPVGGAVQVKIVADLPAGTTLNTFWKFGAEPTNATPHWYEFLFDGTTGATINGNTVTLNFVDGQRGDSDIEANGFIWDPGALAFSTAGPGGQPTTGDPLCFDPILSFVARLPICGLGCSMAIIGSFCGLAAMKAGRARRRRR